MNPIRFFAALPLSQKLSLGLVLLLTLLLAEHRLHFAYDNTPNILYWDQWDLYNSMFRGDNWWGIFTYQHGPHRQGLGGLLLAGLASLTDWDVRGDALLTVGATVAAALLALPLAWKCGVRKPLLLLPLPGIFLTMRQYELWVGPSNPSHGALPLLLTVAYGLAWFVPPRPLRLSLLAGLTFLLIFTGFGLFAGAASLVLLGAETWHSRRDVRALALAGAAWLLVAASWGLFFFHYKNQPAVLNFHFPYERPWEYVLFAALLVPSYLGWHGHGLALLLLGGGALAALAAIALVQGSRCLRAAPSDRPVSAVLFTLSLATLLFCLNTAIGRVSLGWQEAPFASRYTTLLIPGFFAFFLQLLQWRGTPLRWGLWGALTVLVFACGLQLSAGDRFSVNHLREGREQWRKNYLATGSQAKADASTMVPDPFPIYPGDLTGKLEFLRQRQLNLYKPDPLF